MINKDSFVVVEAVERDLAVPEGAPTLLLRFFEEGKRPKDFPSATARVVPLPSDSADIIVEALNGLPKEILELIESLLGRLVGQEEGLPQDTGEDLERSLKLVLESCIEEEEARAAVADFIDTVIRARDMLLGRKMRLYITLDDESQVEEHTARGGTAQVKETAAESPPIGEEAGFTPEEIVAILREEFPGVFKVIIEKLSR